MSRQREQDPLDALRAANPVPDDQLPPASLARLRARVYEDAMGINAARPHRALRFGRGHGILAAAAIAIALVVGLNAGTGLVPGPTTGPGIGMCIEQYSIETLAHRAFAFDGMVTAIDGDRVTFAIGTSYRGLQGSSVTLDAPGMTGTGITPGGGPNLEVGARYLVAGEGTFAWACGFTQPYDAGVASAWSTALLD